jgi:hypothetical protein
MFLLSQTIKEEILPKPIIPTEKYRYRLYLIPGNTDTEKMTGITVVCNSNILQNTPRVSASSTLHTVVKEWQVSREKRRQNHAAYFSMCSFCKRRHNIM